MDTKQMEALKTICVDTNFTDCTIKVNSVKFKCHKIILSTGSEFFQRMFLGDFKESSFPEIQLHDSTPLIFQIFHNLKNQATQTVLSLKASCALIQIVRSQQAGSSYSASVG
ncbi:hypothetical protein ACLKA6_019744 [Drosophila palustris]